VARAHALGVCSKPIPQKKLNVENLTEAIRELMIDPTICQKVEILGEKLRVEDSVGNAVASIERITRR
jgi:sterol 3beta-glucosyltransferase